MKKIILCSFIVLAAAVNAQTGRVGINTEQPVVTLDVAGTPDDATKLDGLAAPRLTGDQLHAKVYTQDQKGALVFATAATSDYSGQVVNVNGPGYYWFDGEVWQSFKSTNAIYEFNISLSKNGSYTIDSPWQVSPKITSKEHVILTAGATEGFTGGINNTKGYVAVRKNGPIAQITIGFSFPSGTFSWDNEGTGQPDLHLPLENIYKEIFKEDVGRFFAQSIGFTVLNDPYGRVIQPTHFYLSSSKTTYDSELVIPITYFNDVNNSLPIDYGTVVVEGTYFVMGRSDAPSSLTETLKK